MTSSSGGVSVIICAYTEARWDALLAAVASVQQQSLPPEQVIVVIDHNPALLARAQAQLQAVSVIANSQGRGLSGARNSGLAVARGAIIAFMDEDAAAAPDWLARIVASYDQPAVLGVGGAIVPAWQSGRPRWFPSEFDWVVGCTYTGMPTTTTPVRNLIGCNMSFRREVFERVGGFQHGIGRVGALPVGCEETELCIRLAQHWPGAQLRYDPSARVRHLVPDARARFSYFRSRCYNEGRSKALVARLVGARDGLASERAYTQRTLPLGFARGLRDTLRGDLSGLLRAGAIVLGLATTVMGYAAGKLALGRGPARLDEQPQSQPL